MDDDLSVETLTAETPVSCDRCRDLGLDHPTIRPGEAFYRFARGGASADCCVDCWRKLNEDLGAAEGIP